jgi:acyl-CoA dehydrogenase
MSITERNEQQTQAAHPIPEAPSTSFWDASPALRAILERKLSAADFAWALPQLERMGRLAASDVAPLAAIADRESPTLLTHDARGERVDRVEFHPAYREMERIAYGSGMITMKYDAETLRSRPDAVHLTSFALGYLFSMAEMGLYCPLCMTDGLARVLTLHGTSQQIERAVPHLASSDPGRLWTGAMFLTERQGGSDVGANETVARPTPDGRWLLSGSKWFCSNVNAEAALVTARPEGAPRGTKALRTYLLLTRGNPGMRIDRIKEKLGVRSMATGEVTLDGAVAEEIGGFDATAVMLNMSRLYNAVASVAVIGRAAHEARSYVEQRSAFGRRVIEHPLAAETLLDLEAEHLAALLMVFETVDAQRKADGGDDEAALLLRILTPIGKAITGKIAVPLVSEALELIGGNGYIEESVMPRLLRDAQVLPVWEGTTNVLMLDALRAAKKEEAHRPLLARIARRFPEEAAGLESAVPALDERGSRGWVDRAARLFQLTLLDEAGETAAFDRMKDRPLGLVPGARP